MISENERVKWYEMGRNLPCHVLSYSRVGTERNQETSQGIGCPNLDTALKTYVQITCAAGVRADLPVCTDCYIIDTVGNRSSTWHQLIALFGLGLLAKPSTFTDAHEPEH